MELKTIIAIALVVFIIGGLIFVLVPFGKKLTTGMMKARKSTSTWAPPFYIPKKKGALMMKERFEQRLFRIFAQAGYSPVQLLTITPEEMVEIPGITVPNIRAVLCVQNKVLADRNKVRSGRLVEELLKEAEESRCCHE